MTGSQVIAVQTTQVFNCMSRCPKSLFIWKGPSRDLQSYGRNDIMWVFFPIDKLPSVAPQAENSFAMISFRFNLSFVEPSMHLFVHRVQSSIFWYFHYLQFEQCLYQFLVVRVHELYRSLHHTQPCVGQAAVSSLSINESIGQIDDCGCNYDGNHVCSKQCWWRCWSESKTSRCKACPKLSIVTNPQMTVGRISIGRISKKKKDLSPDVSPQWSNSSQKFKDCRHGAVGRCAFSSLCLQT